MSVRYRLFVIVGTLFCAIFIGSFFLENRLSVKGVSELKADLRSFYEDLEKDKRDTMQGLISSVFFRRLGEVNAALEVISRFRRVKEFFAPTEENREKGTWISAASLLQDRETIDFIQNTYGDAVTSCIIPRHEGLRDTMQEEIDEDLSWVFIEKNATPYVGVALHLSTENDGAIRSDAVPGIVPRVFLLYKIEALKSLNIDSIRGVFAKKSPLIPLSVPFMGGFRLDLLSFVEALSRAKDYAEREGDVASDKRGMKSPLPKVVSEKDACISQACFLDQRVSYVNQIFMIWELCCLLETGIMDGGIDAISAPSAISFFPDDTGKGGGIFVKDVLRETAGFDGKAFFSSEKGEESLPLQTDKTALIVDEKRSKLYLGNVAALTLERAKENKVGYITLGFDIENALKNLSTGYRQQAMIIAGGKIYSFLDANGARQSVPSMSSDVMKKLLSNKLGLVNVEGVSYYFVHLMPIPSLDLHIMLFTKAAEEFSLMRNLSGHFQDTLDKIGSERRWVIVMGLLVLLLALLDLSKKITQPVVLMAEAARSVSRSGLQSVSIPKFKLGKRNEVQQLSIAFSEMIEGLKEKERVKAVLNKVVSHDIASEILKGDVHLGGEDRVVTMFFADVRRFTHLTQNMAPHKVIELVNTCMTKLSLIIDKHHGVIDKYVGDEVMVLFGAPVAHEDSAYQAVLCGIDVIEELKKWNETRVKEGLPPVNMGIGIHTGKVCAGNMGAENRMNYTVIGSNVNMAARLCSKAAPSEIVISSDTLSDPLVEKNIMVEDMGFAELKGFDEPKKMYRVKGMRS